MTTQNESGEGTCAKCGDLNPISGGNDERARRDAGEPRCTRLVHDMAQTSMCALPANADVHRKADDKGGHPFETLTGKVAKGPEIDVERERRGK